jgi:serine/threonine-protein kinase
MVVGTVGYVAPEQLLGLPFDHRADLYALGAIVFFMVAGRAVFAGANVDIIDRQLGAPAPRLRSACAGVEDSAHGEIVDALAAVLLQRHPRDRFASARAVGQVARLALQRPAEATALLGFLMSDLGAGGGVCVGRAGRGTTRVDG